MKFHWRWCIVIAIGLLTAITDYSCRWARRESSQDKVILAIAPQYGVDPALVKAVIWRESKFDPEARGSSGEIGLMQIMSSTGEDWAKAEKVKVYWHRRLFDPEKNIRAGTWYLRKMLSRYQQTDNPIPYALAAYNAGPGNADKWAKGAAARSSSAFIQQISFPGTQEYVKSIMQRYEHYRRRFPPPVEKK